MNKQELRRLKLTRQQLNAAKSVYKAMRKASKLGVSFWDNYGKLQCYNSLRTTCPVPDDARDVSLYENDPTYYESLDNFHCGNADDDLYYDILEINND